MRGPLTSMLCSACTRGRWEKTETPATYYIVPRERAGLKEAENWRTQGPPSPWTKYRWTGCGIEITNRTKVCGTMEKLGLRRLLIVGDSISYMHAQSLLHLMDASHEDIIVSKQYAPSQLRRQFTKDLNCFDFEYVRNDYLIGKCDKCLEWLDNYFKGPATLLIINSGAHQTTNFQSRIHDLLSLIADKATERNDVVLWRTAYAGHPNCSSSDVPLLEPPPPLSIDKFHWNAFKDHSSFLRATLQADARYSRFGLLDIVPMTELRPDGHRPEFHDCLHYYLPSVVDWWSHLLFTRLASFAAENQLSSPVVGDSFC